MRNIINVVEYFTINVFFCLLRILYIIYKFKKYYVKFKFDFIPSNAAKYENYVSTCRNICLFTRLMCVVSELLINREADDDSLCSRYCITKRTNADLYRGLGGNKPLVICQVEVGHSSAFLWYTWPECVLLSKHKHAYNTHNTIPV